MRYTADTLALVKARNPGVDFVWIMGADNLRDFHRWQRWRQIAMTFPIAVIDRPGATLSFLSSVVAKTFDYARVDEADAPLLGAHDAAGLDLHPRPALVAVVERHPRGGAPAVKGSEGLLQARHSLGPRRYPSGDVAFAAATRHGTRERVGRWTRQRQQDPIGRDRRAAQASRRPI